MQKHISLKRMKTLNDVKYSHKNKSETIKYQLNNLNKIVSNLLSMPIIGLF